MAAVVGADLDRNHSIAAADRLDQAFPRLFDTRRLRRVHLDDQAHQPGLRKFRPRYGDVVAGSPFVGAGSRISPGARTSFSTSSPIIRISSRATPSRVTTISQKRR